MIRDTHNAIHAGRVLGSILAGAVGDALGGPVEFLSIEEIRHTFGPRGACDLAPAYGGRGKITDDTQMTLFTMDGLIRAHVARRRKGHVDLVPVLQHAYQRWLHTQGAPWPQARGTFGRDPGPGGWLIANSELFDRRAPGSTVLAALTAFATGAPSASPERPANNSKGCGAVMRAAPFALWSADPAEVFEAASITGALTHGHPSGYLPAGTLAVIVQHLLLGTDILTAVDAARDQLARWPGHEETDRALGLAIDLGTGPRPSPELIAQRLGGGWVGEEALSIGLCAALAADDLADGLLLAVNHSGDSDSTGAICGNILGARHGTDSIPTEWLNELELREVIEELAVDLLTEFGPAPPATADWDARYPPW